MIEKVRNLTSEKTHWADVKASAQAVLFGVTYVRPESGTVTLCGVHVKDGVVMQPESKVGCIPCKHVKAVYHTTRG